MQPIHVAPAKLRITISYIWLHPGNNNNVSSKRFSHCSGDVRCQSWCYAPAGKRNGPAAAWTPAPSPRASSPASIYSIRPRVRPSTPRFPSKLRYWKLHIMLWGRFSQKGFQWALRKKNLTVFLTCFLLFSGSSLKICLKIFSWKLFLCRETRDGEELKRNYFGALYFFILYDIASSSYKKIQTFLTPTTFPFLLKKR